MIPVATTIFVMCLSMISIPAMHIRQPNISTLSDEEVPSSTPPVFVPIDLPLDLSEFMKAHPTLDQTAGCTNCTDCSPSQASSKDSTTEKCECGIFNTKTPTEIDVPLWSHPPTSATCDIPGELTCLKTCSIFEKAAKESHWICTILGNYNKLKASIHSRNCDAPTWTYTGLTSPNEICCFEHQVVPCTDKLVTPPTNLV